MDSEIQSSDLNSDQQDEPKAKKEKLDVLIERNDKEGKITLRKVTPVTTEVVNSESVNSRTTQKNSIFHIKFISNSDGSTSVSVTPGPIYASHPTLNQPHDQMPKFSADYETIKNF